MEVIRSLTTKGPILDTNTRLTDREGCTGGELGRLRVSSALITRTPSQAVTVIHCEQQVQASHVLHKQLYWTPDLAR